MDTLYVLINRLDRVYVKCDIVFRRGPICVAYAGSASYTPESYVRKSRHHIMKGRKSMSICRLQENEILLPPPSQLVNRVSGPLA